MFVIGSFTIDGFLSATNIKAILLFASFLGIACVGQTLVALLGGLDLSIPFVIGAANIGLLYLSASACRLGSRFVAGADHRRPDRFPQRRHVLSSLQGQALILTLGTGFAVAGLVQIITSIGSRSAATYSARCRRGCRISRR